jgi:hypothetical protein
MRNAWEEAAFYLATHLTDGNDPYRFAHLMSLYPYDAPGSAALRNVGVALRRAFESRSPEWRAKVVDAAVDIEREKQQEASCG